jgi:hypothetical protein
MEGEMKFSERAETLLTLINDCTVWEGDERPGRKLARYFYPRVDGIWSPTLNRLVKVSTAGDASALRALESKGLIARMKPTEHSGPDRYCYAITEDGILALSRPARDLRP